ncbi:methionyl-tRNA formyltransferase [Granulicatella elegans]|uniref:methionyl-tRNA formyltransferase n=1 Tax=Granulicatella elegans TaxID=137732 RepID=UPI000AEC748D|nr:methionyl-tRNA formyltransferase [Granulicatella elegans]UEA30810.1 methionyl-tRNA formyltransferase [Granulicatella elegans]
MKKIIFMGTPEFSTKVLHALVNSEEYEVIAVVTQPDRPVGRKKVITPSPVKKYALEQNIAVYQPEKLTGSEELEQLMTLDADLIVTAAYGQFLPKKFLEFPKQGAVNVHASLLPKYRGGAPIHYAIMNGDSHTGVTIMRMVSKMDAGNILSQRSIPIEQEDDVASMFEKLSVVGAELLLDTLPQIFDGTITEIVQDEAFVTYSPNITREQEQIDWTKEARMVDCFIRGLRPWPTSFTILNGERVKIWQVKVVEQTTAEQPGTLFKENHQLYVACGNQTVLEIIELQPAGKAKMSSESFMNGFASVIEEKACFEGVNHG